MIMYPLSFFFCNVVGPLSSPGRSILMSLFMWTVWNCRLYERRCFSLHSCNGDWTGGKLLNTSSLYFKAFLKVISLRFKYFVSTICFFRLSLLLKSCLSFLVARFGDGFELFIYNRILWFSRYILWASCFLTASLRLKCFLLNVF